MRIIEFIHASIYDHVLCVMREAQPFRDVPELGLIVFCEEEMMLTNATPPLKRDKPKPFSFDRRLFDYGSSYRQCDHTDVFYRLTDYCV